MKLKWILLPALAILAVQAHAAVAPPDANQPAVTQPAATTPATDQSSVLKTEKDKVSYCFGMNMARNFMQNGIEINPEMLAKGLTDALAGGKLLMTADEYRTTMTAFQQAMQEKMKKVDEERKKAEEEWQKGSAARLAANKKEGDAFLAENKKKPNVITLPSGLQYKILKAGTGKKPTAQDSVVCNYRGTLISGTQFDSSYDRGEPAKFAVGEVIAGWTEALKLMPVGSKWQLFVPGKLAYGDAGRPPTIPEDATLIFEVELLSIAAK